MELALAWSVLEKRFPNANFSIDTSITRRYDKKIEEEYTVAVHFMMTDENREDIIVCNKPSLCAAMDEVLAEAGFAPAPDIAKIGAQIEHITNR